MTTIHTSQEYKIGLTSETNLCNVLSSSWCSVVSDSLRPHGLQPTRLFCPWNFPGKNTGVGCVSYSGGSPRPRGGARILHCRWTLYHCATQEPQKVTFFTRHKSEGRACHLLYYLKYYLKPTPLSQIQKTQQFLVKKVHTLGIQKEVLSTW